MLGRVAKLLDTVVSPTAQVWSCTLTMGSMVYISNGVPIFFERPKTKKELCPTIFTLWKLPDVDMVPCVRVHSGISEFILKGADVLVSGMPHSDGLDELRVGQNVMVKVEGNPMAFAVGVTAATGVEICGALANARALRAVTVLHVYNDVLFKKQDLAYLPAPEGFSATAVRVTEVYEEDDNVSQATGTGTGTGTGTAMDIAGTGRVGSARTPGMSFRGNLASPIHRAESPTALGQDANGTSKMTSDFLVDELLDKTEQVDIQIGDIRNELHLAESKHSEELDKMIVQQVELLRHAETKTTSLASLCHDCLERTGALRELGEHNHQGLKEVERRMLELFRFKQLTELDVRHKDEESKGFRKNISALLLDTDDVKNSLKALETETTELLGELLGHSRSVRVENRALKEEVSSLRQDVTKLAKTMDLMCTRSDMNDAVCLTLDVGCYMQPPFFTPNTTTLLTHIRTCTHAGVSG
jgi:predicted ribosome-associated RNA-binding protein Tma20